MTLVLSIGMMGMLAVTGRDVVPTRVADELFLARMGTVHVGGFLGERIDRNLSGRLKHVPMGQLLGGFQRRQGGHPWIGEHIGKWLHASVRAWQYCGDADLKGRIDRAVAELLATQEENGYLGTYEQEKRWSSWDVWVHKYNLIGLLAYYEAKGDRAALRGARGVGDLLALTFGPGKRDIIEVGHHVGMASTSVLEPMVYLYRATGEARYLAFCKYLVESWDQANGPMILSGLLDHGKVNQVGNGKAYEMLSNLVGLCELYRTTGDERYGKAVRAAWDDIWHNRLYITGSTSWHEMFWPDGYLPDTGDAVETCVTVTWLQLSMRLLALTGEIKYADVIEQTIYNHLLGAQAEDGNDWCVFCTLAGVKLLRSDVNCCHSSGPRGVALLPRMFYGTSAGRLRINLYGASRFDGDVPGVGKVEVTQRTTFPADGRVEIEVRPAKSTSFRLELRIPSWSKTTRLMVNDEAVDVGDQRLVVLDREWRVGDVVTLHLDVAPQWIRGTGEHKGKLTARKGPFVLCASERWNPDLPCARLIGVEETSVFSEAGEIPDAVGADKPFLTSAPVKVLTPDGLKEEHMVWGPFALVQKETFAVWLSAAANLLKFNPSALRFGREGYSRQGYVYGSLNNGDFNDGDAKTYRVTYDGTHENQDWWEVVLEHPVKIRRVVFCHGHAFGHGGWFDTSEGKPEVLVQITKGGEWKQIGRLETYPETTAEQQPELVNGQAFELTVEPMKVYGVRVVGKPACGDKPGQAFSSCAELTAEGVSR